MFASDADCARFHVVLQIVACMVVLGSIFIPMSARAQSRLRLPVDLASCDISDAEYCYSGYLFDHDDSSAEVDYRCRALTYSPHNGIDYLAYPQRWGPVLVASSTSGLITDVSDSICVRDRCQCLGGCTAAQNSVCDRSCGGGFGNTVRVLDEGVRPPRLLVYAHLMHDGAGHFVDGRWARWDEWVPIECGETIGRMGSSGSSSWQHVHLAVYETVDAGMGDPARADGVHLVRDTTCVPGATLCQLWSVSYVGNARRDPYAGPCNDDAMSTAESLWRDQGLYRSSSPRVSSAAELRNDAYRPADSCLSIDCASPDCRSDLSAAGPALACLGRVVVSGAIAPVETAALALAAAAIRRRATESADSAGRYYPCNMGGGLGVHRWSVPGAASSPSGIILQNVCTSPSCPPPRSGTGAIISSPRNESAYLLDGLFWQAYSCLLNTNGPRYLGVQITA